MVEALIEQVRPGMTEAQMFGIVHKAMFDNGGTPIFLIAGIKQQFSSQYLFS